MYFNLVYSLTIFPHIPPFPYYPTSSIFLSPLCIIFAFQALLCIRPIAKKILPTRFYTLKKTYSTSSCRYQLLCSSIRVRDFMPTSHLTLGFYLSWDLTDLFFMSNCLSSYLPLPYWSLLVWKTFFFAIYHHGCYHLSIPLFCNYFRTGGWKNDIDVPFSGKYSVISSFPHLEQLEQLLFSVLITIYSKKLLWRGLRNIVISIIISDRNSVLCLFCRKILLDSVVSSHRFMVPRYISFIVQHES